MKAPAFWWRDRGGAASLALTPIAAVWRRTADERIARAPRGRLPIPVICVGNPTVGGAGKTPTAITLAAIVAGLDKQPFFLTRGYRGQARGPLLVEPDRHSVADVGDEALLLARHAPTVVAADRVAGGTLAYERGADAVIMDDGFQNPALFKDFTLLVVDGVVGVGNGRVLPAGPLRASLGSQWPLAQALTVVGGGAAGERLAALAAAAGVAVWQAYLVGRAPHLVGRRVVAFAGIGRPAKFFATLREIGADVVAEKGFPDHHRYTDQDAASLLEIARACDALPVTTEKDAARLWHCDGTLARLREATSVIPAKLVFETPGAVETAIAAIALRRRG